MGDRPDCIPPIPWMDEHPTPEQALLGKLALVIKVAYESRGKYRSFEIGGAMRVANETEHMIESGVAALGGIENLQRLVDEGRRETPRSCDRHPDCSAVNRGARDRGLPMPLHTWIGPNG